MKTNASDRPVLTQPRAAGALAGLLGCLALPLCSVLGSAQPTTDIAPPQCTALNTVTAQVVALEQIYYYNRFGSFNPSGVMYALRRDVVAEDGGTAIPLQPSGARDLALAGHVQLRPDKRPRPLVLRVNEGDCLRVTFTNLLAPTTGSGDIVTEPSSGQKILVDADEPATRRASMHVNGLNFADSILADGSNVGRNDSTLAAPGETLTYTWYGKQEGGYLLYSMGAAAGGEGDGGQLGLGLFGAVNVEPAGAKWYRSQVTAAELAAAADGQTRFNQPKLKYDATFTSGPNAGRPVLAILQGREIVYSDLNAVIDVHPRIASGTGVTPTTGATGEDCAYVTGPGSVCGLPYREFTTIFHDEITAIQAFPELDDETNPLYALRDGTAINYGSSGMGAMVVANQRRVGPAKDCIECKLEEFFLTSWVNGDPAMVVERDANNKPVRALYPDDPSNVHHSYMGDPVRFRNIHAGPKETHVFHLHAHQWVQDKHDPNSVYLDSQTISPGASFTYEIHYGGSGNRNFVVGDSIFHCHLYPHFAQGMWELWRSHDVFEDGSQSRNLPDAELTGGTPNPAIIPLPRTALPRMPTPDVKGYPFFVAGAAGHRPPQPPKDLDRDPVTGEVSDGGLPRHRFVASTRESNVADIPTKNPDDPTCLAPAVTADLYDRGKGNAACIAGRVRKLNTDPNLVGLATKLLTAQLELLRPQPGDTTGNDGTTAERRAMEFHDGNAGVDGQPGVTMTTQFGWVAKGFATCDSAGNCDTPASRVLFRVNGSSGPRAGAPYANPCPAKFDDDTLSRVYRTAYIQLDMTVNKAGWHDPQARIAVLEQDIRNTFAGTRPTEPLFMRARSGECVVFKATNLVPSTLNLDDFQIFSPTDVLGQHIHLVKFDVTSSDGSANGWNYEDGTLSADEVRERIAAYNRYQIMHGLPARLTPKVHKIFGSNGNMAGDPRGVCPPGTDPAAWDTADMAAKHPFCGAQTTVQRWWVDPLLNNKGNDRTLRTVFTHDHLGPSSHQHHGLYAALVAEPAGSIWETVDGKTRLGTRTGPDGDGGPTSYSANIITANPATVCGTISSAACVDADHTAREFNLAFADYALTYTTDQPSDRTPANRPVNPVNRVDANLPNPTLHTGTPMPEGISTKDPGTQLINYRNEPIPLRIGEQKVYPAGVKPPNPFACNPVQGGGQSCTVQRDNGLAGAGNMANVFSSKVHIWQENAGAEIFTEKIGAGRVAGDPATPLLMAYAGDRVQVRLIQGAHEENHIFSMHGMKWLSQPDSPNSGYMNGQPIGISEHFEFNIAIHPVTPKLDVDYLYGSPATDNTWDGQWGILRAFAWDKNPVFLKRLPNNPVIPGLLPIDATPCPAGVPQRDIAVTAGLARQIYESVPGANDGTVTYNRNFGLSDPGAIVFVRTRETFQATPADPNAVDKIVCDQASANASTPPCFNRRRAEPLILRAAAGECIRVTLKNQLPVEMPDTVRVVGDPRYAEYPASWSFNSMPATVKGFNFNQFTSSNRVSLHPQLVALNGVNKDGSYVGNNIDSTVAPGAALRYEWYAGDFSLRPVNRADGVTVMESLRAPIEFGAIALRDSGDVIKHSSHGAIGALVIEPENATWRTDLENGINDLTNASATVDYTDFTGTLRRFRDFAVLYQDDISLRQNGTALPNLRNADDAEDTGHKAFNYRSEPLWARLGAAPSADPDFMAGYDFSNALSSRVPQGQCRADIAHGVFCDPETPVFQAEAGMEVRFRVVDPAGHPRNHGFTLFGHDWILNPWVCDTESTVMGWNVNSQYRFGSAYGIGPMRHINIVTVAGGDFHVPGDYLYRTQEGFQFSGGLWGIFRVTAETGGWHPPPPRKFCAP